MQFLRDTDQKVRNIPACLKRFGRFLIQRDAASLVYLADGLRVVGLLYVSLRLIEKTRRRELPPRVDFHANLIHATTLQYMGRHRDAMDLFVGCEKDAGDKLSLSFALQHHAKCLIEAGAYGEAKLKLDEAFGIRQAHGEAHLVDSTQKALEALALLTNDIC